NAFTSKEHTCFYARVLDQHFELAAEVLSDMFRNSLFLESEVEKEKGVIAEEIRLYEDSPDELVHDLFSEAVLDSHPLGKNILGNVENVERITSERIRNFMGAHYTARNLVVAVAGNISHDRAAGAIADYLADTGGEHVPVVACGVTSRPRTLIRRKDTEQVHVCIGSIGLARNRPDKFALYVLDTVLGGGMSSRLFQELREDRGLVYSTYSYHSCFQDAGLFSVYAGTSPENARQVLAIIREELAGISEDGITDEEMARARQQLKGSLMLSLESTASRMSRLAKSELFYEGPITPDELMAKVDAVTQDEVRSIARELFSRGEYALAAIGPITDPWNEGESAEPFRATA
ncbi:MAG: insulinase family protein, partial [Firmicutes bacterium]|nr:insulinase family protein [Bacillota bacterium]